MGEEKGEIYMINKETGEKIRLIGGIKPLPNIKSDETNIGIDFGGSADMTFIYKNSIKQQQLKSKRLKKKYFKRTLFYKVLNGGKNGRR